MAKITEPYKYPKRLKDKSDTGALKEGLWNVFVRDGIEISLKLNYESGITIELNTKEILLIAQLLHKEKMFKLFP